MSQNNSAGTCLASDWINYPVAIIQTITCTFYLTFYIPCLIVMLRTESLYKKSCYKIMICMGFADIYVLFCGYGIAFMSAVGAPLCQTFAYVFSRLVGSVSNGK